MACMGTGGPITKRLVRIREGDRAAFDDLMPRVYPELHRIAERYFRRNGPITLNNPPLW
jgi:hypothetical protein